MTLQKAYACLWGLSSDGLVRGGQVLQGGRERGLLGGGERAKLQPAPGHEPGLPVGADMPPSDHGAPDHLGRERQGPQGRREIELAAGIEAQEIDVFDLRAREAEIA
jgi:hypothetical protein